MVVIINQKRNSFNRKNNYMALLNYNKLLIRWMGPNRKKTTEEKLEKFHSTHVFKAIEEKSNKKSNE